MIIPISKLAILLGVVSCALDQSAVTERNGMIFLKRPNGERMALTTTGRDSGPFITQDGKMVLFCRRDLKDDFRTSIYSIDLQSHVEKLLFAGPVVLHNSPITLLASPQLDTANETLYVLARNGVTTGILFALDLRTSVIHEVAEATNFALIRSGEYAGDLLVSKRHTTLVGDPFFYNIYWLYNPEGKNLGIAGPDSFDISSITCPPSEATEQRRDERLPAQKRREDARAATINVDSALMAKRLKVRVEPEYPNDAKEGRVEGVVRLIVTVAEDGSVSGVQLISGHPSLVLAAMEAVRQWKYEPYALNGRNVRVNTMVDVTFSLNR